MRLITPTLTELRSTITCGGEYWRSSGRTCDDDALPPVFVLQRAIDLITAQPQFTTWFALRLFWLEEARAIVGSGGYKNPPTDPDGIEVGYGIAARHQGRGYASLALRLLLADAWALTAAPLVFATVRPDNPASLRVLEKCGFAREGDGLDTDGGLLWRFVHLRPSSAGSG